MLGNAVQLLYGGQSGGQGDSRGTQGNDHGRRLGRVFWWQKHPGFCEPLIPARVSYLGSPAHATRQKDSHRIGDRAEAATSATSILTTSYKNRLAPAQSGTQPASLSNNGSSTARM